MARLLISWWQTGKQASKRASEQASKQAGGHIWVGKSLLRKGASPRGFSPFWTTMWVVAPSCATCFGRLCGKHRESHKSRLQATDGFPCREHHSRGTTRTVATKSRCFAAVVGENTPLENGGNLRYGFPVLRFEICIELLAKPTVMPTMTSVV